MGYQGFEGFNRLGSGTYNRTSTTQVSPSSVPTLPVAPYTPPVYDYGRLESLSQQFAAPAIGRLRRGVREATMAGQYEENPAIRAMMARRTLEGYGSGIGDTLASARGTAANTYGQEYGNQNQAAYATWLEQMARERGQISTASQMTEQEQRVGMSSGVARRPTTTFLNIPTPSMGGGASSSGGVSPGGGQWGGGQAGYWGASGGTGVSQRSDAYTQASPERQAQIDYVEWASKNS